jgi:acetyl esterase/lipase
MNHLGHLLLALAILSESQTQNVKRTFPYADSAHERQVLDVYSRPNAKNLPVVFWIHGGGWVTGDMADVHGKPKVFADKGFVFVSTNYRLLPGVDLATIVRDVAKSVRWVHDHIAEHGGDPNRLFIMGHSAGAQLAALLCTDERYLKAKGLSLAIVKGCVPVDGDTYDVPAIIETAETRRRVHGLPQLKYGHREKFGNDPAKHRDLSAVTHVAKDKGIPPFLILHVAEHPDTSAQAQRLGNVLKGAGVPVTVFGARDTTHGKINADLGSPDDPATKALFAFLEKARKKPEPRREAGFGAAARSVQGMRLKVSPNGRYFVDQDGRPFFYLGDTAWLLFQRLDRAEVEEYLHDRAGKGFTVIQAYVLRGLGARHPDGNRSLLGEPPLLDRDPTRPNEAFFKNVDFVINRANELGLVMGLVVAKSWHVNQHPERVFDAANAYTFGKFLGARYKKNAVLWYVGGDSAPGKDEAVWVAMARGLKDGSGGAHLVSYHGQGQTSSSMWFHKAAWLDFNSIQSGHGWAAKTDRFIDRDYVLSPAKPTVDMEPPYENHPTGARTPRIDAHQVRQAAYRNMLAGAAGHGYGALDLFWLYKEGDGPFPKNGFQPWRKALAYPGARQVGHMRRLFELRPWYKLVPDQSALAEGQGEGEDYARAARAADGSFVLAYLPAGKPVRIQMDKVTGKAVKAWWYDPREGTWLSAGEYANKGSREFTAPSRGAQDDWLLVLDDAGKNYPVGKSKGGDR